MKRIALAITATAIASTAIAFAPVAPLIPLLAGTAGAGAATVGTTAVLTTSGLKAIGFGALGLTALAAGIVVMGLDGEPVTVIAETDTLNNTQNPDLSPAGEVNPGPEVSWAYALTFDNFTHRYLNIHGEPIIGATTFASRVNHADNFSNRVVLVEKLQHYFLDRHGIDIRYVRPDDGVEYPKDSWITTQTTVDQYCPSGQCIVLNVSFKCPTFWAPDTCGSNLQNISNFPAITGINYRQVSAGHSTAPARAQLHIPATSASVETVFSCPEGSRYSHNGGYCYLGTLSMISPRTCVVSFSASNGAPIYNLYDTDCTIADVKVSSGSATTPPSVSVTDSSTGKTLTVERAHVSTQGAPGTVKITERVPDYANNTTRVNTTNVEKVGTNQPVTTGSTQQTLPGVGVSVGTTPLPSVEIANWPHALNQVAPHLADISATAVNILAELVNQRPVAQNPPGTSSFNPTPEPVVLGDGGSALVQDASNTDANDTFLNSILSFKSFSPSYSAQSCSTALDTSSNSAQIFGMSMSLDLAQVCPLISSHENTIRSLALAVWTILSVLIFIRLTI